MTLTFVQANTRLHKRTRVRAGEHAALTCLLCGMEPFCHNGPGLTLSVPVRVSEEGVLVGASE